MIKKQTAVPSNCRRPSSVRPHVIELSLPPIQREGCGLLSGVSLLGKCTLLLSTIYPPHLSTMGDVIPQFSGVKVVIRFTLKLVTDEDHVTVIGDVVWKSSAIFRVAYTVIQGLNVPA